MIKTKNLIAFYPMDSLVDSSGNGQTLSGNNSPLIVSGKIGKCGEYDETNWHSATIGIVPCPQMTLCAWVLTDTLTMPPGAYHRMFVAMNTLPYLSLINTGDFACSMRIGAVQKIVYATPVGLIQIGNWYHIAGVYDGVNLSLYINGILYSQIPATGEATYNSSLNIGRWGGTSPTWALDGKVDEVGFYSKALSETDVRRVMMGLHPIGG